MLRDAGYEVREQTFEYSQFPGRFATPLAGFIAAGGMIAIARLGHAGFPILSLTLWVTLVAIVVGGGGWIGSTGVLSCPLMRRHGVNIEAIPRGRAELPRVWVVAHLDSKWQPIPIGVRALGIVLLSAALVATPIVAVVQLLDPQIAATWRWVGILGVGGALPVMASFVGRGSDGAADNASGVATLLAVAESLRANINVGLLITDGEELALAGARAWARTRMPGVAINVDTIDDRGICTIMTVRKGDGLAARLSEAGRASGVAMRVMPLIPGIITDSVALASAGWETATVSWGDRATLGRLHTSRDTTRRCTGSNVAAAARIVSDAARLQA